MSLCFVFFSSRRRHTSCALVTGVQTCALPICRDLAWLRRHIPDDAHCVVTDVTAGEAVLAVMGPHSRDLLAQASPDDLTDAAFPFSTAREIEEIGRAHV